MVTKGYIYTVWFEIGSAKILDIGHVDQGIMRWHHFLPDHRVRVTGCYNPEREVPELALQRAKVVYRYLVNHGVEFTRIDSLVAERCTPPRREDLLPDYPPQMYDMLVRYMYSAEVDFYNPYFSKGLNQNKLKFSRPLSSNEEAKSTDYVDTQLDLAAAYFDMGDQVGARSLLEEIIKEGKTSQQQQAEAMLKRLRKEERTTPIIVWLLLISFVVVAIAVVVMRSV